MKWNKTHKIAYLVLIVVVISACAQSNSWGARQFRDTKAHYNIFFNAEELWKETNSTLRNSLVDDFTKPFLVYNLGSGAGLKNNQPSMDEVIKGTSNLIDKYPKSKWVDDAILLNGKAYLYKGDFYASQDLFDNVIATSKDLTVVYTAKLLFFKSLLLQEKYEEAESFILGLKDDEKIPSKLKWQLNLAIADGYIAQNKISQAQPFLLLAAPYVKGKLNKYRTYFALANACQQMELYPEAQKYYSKVYKLNPPYEIAFQSKIALEQILSSKTKSYVKADRILKSMLKDDKNIDYYSKIYYEMAKNELNSGKTSLAMEHFNKAITEAKIKGDVQQLAVCYITLGDYFFKSKDYIKSGNYYDSASQNIDAKFPNFEQISKRNERLKVLVENMINIQLQDSLLRMSTDIAFREKCIDKAIEQEKLDLANKRASKNTVPVVPSLGGLSAKSSFPLYNPQQRTQGQQDFERKFGKRLNTDFWRYKSKQQKNSNFTNTSSKQDSVKTEIEDPSLLNITPERKKYVARIPLTDKLKDEAYNSMEVSYLAIADQYLNALDQPDNSLYYYKKLLELNSATKYKAQVLYEIAKIYQKLGKVNEAKEYEDLLAAKYPNSNYTKLLQGKELEVDKTETTQSSISKELADALIKLRGLVYSGKITEALSYKSEVDKLYLGNVYQPKFDFLQGLATYKSGDTKAALEILNRLIVDYPNTADAKEAEKVIQGIEIKNNPILKDTTLQNQNWVAWNGTDEFYYLLTFGKQVNSNLIRAALADYCSKNNVLEKLEVSKPISAGGSVFMYISGFEKPQNCVDFTNRLKANPQLFTSKGLNEYKQSTITQINLSTLTLNGNIDGYFIFIEN